MAWWVALFDKIAASDFMRESAAQKANWLTIDWVLNEHNLMKILEGKYDSERPVIAEIHRKHVVHSAPQNTQASAETSEPSSGIPEDARRRMSEMYRIWHGTNEGNPYEAASVSDASGEVPAIDAEFGKTSSKTPEAMQEVSNEDIAGDEVMSQEEFQAFLEEQRQIAEEYEEYEKAQREAVDYDR